MSDKEGKNIDEISSKIKEDEKKYSSTSRFGFFSIPYSAYMGDRYYSQNRQKIYRTEDKKVITEARGVFTNPPKKGKFVDAYFHNDYKQDMSTLTKIAETVKKEREDYIKEIKGKKKGGENQEVFKAKFKPGGPQEYKDYFELHPFRYQVPITKDIDKKKKIDKEHRSVYTENRGIYTKPPKRGTSSTPGVLFADNKEDPKLVSMKEKWASEGRLKPRSKSAKEGREFKMAFRPAALMKNGTFQKDSDIYGEDPIKLKKILENASQVSETGS